VAGIATARLGGPALTDLARMHRRMPVTTLCLVIAALSIIGVPPTGGFFSKWYLLLGAVQSGQWPFAVIVLVGGLLAVVYMFRILEHACLEPRGGELGGHVGASHAPSEPAHGVGSGADRGRSGGGSVRRREPPALLLIPLFLLTAGILAAGLFNVAIVETLLRRALPAGLAMTP
jgi:multicomponent Na+:H+ antiporter subunit D